MQQQQQQPPPPHSPSAAAAAPVRPAPPSNEGAATQDPLPFTSLPSWPQTHILHQAAQAQQAAADGHLHQAHHAYLHHTLQLAQRAAMHAKPPPSLNSLKLQEYLNLQSSMSSPSASGDRPPLPQQLKQPVGPQVHRQPPPSQQQQQQQQRSMGFLFGQSSSSPILHSAPVQATRPPMTSAPAQQFVVPESVQSRMLIMQKAGAESPHLRLGPQQAEVEAASINGTNGLVGGHGLSRGGYQHSPSPELGPSRSMVPPQKQQSPLQRLTQPQASPPQAPTAAQPQQHLVPPAVPTAAAKTFGFTRQQLMVLRAQILAFRRLKRGDRSFTVDMVRAITPAPLAPSPQAPSAPAAPAVKVSKPSDTGDDKAQQEGGRVQESGVARKVGETVQEAAFSSSLSRPGDEETKEEMAGALNLEQRKGQGSWRYRGPLFDAPPEGAASTPPNVWGSPLAFGYDAAELLMQEGERIICKKKAKKLKVIEMLLLDDVPAELKLKLRIEQRKLILLEMQTKIRNEIEEHQQEIMAMGERAYRKFVRLCERQRMELARQVMVVQKATKEKYLKSIVQWRKKLFETHWSIREARGNRNKGVVKFHERLLREFSKRKDEDRSKRMEALKNNDVDAYRAMLIKQQKEIPGDAEQRFEVLSSFLTQTEDYLHKLGTKISAVKSQQEKEEAALAAAAAARAQGLPEEEVERASAQARNLAPSSRAWKLDNASGGSSVTNNRYYSLAHAVNEQIVRQPSMLRAGILRDYQLVGLQWMLSLYNNRLNGILADEMGLGKTVQVMALVAYLMEFKGNYGPHLIIVPNAVIVNWKSELLRWLPSVSCIFYVGVREERARIYSQEVAALKFNVLVTTYEFIMRDRSKLAKIDWKYIIIDEAQRMKDRESRLARDLDRFRCQRRLLLTGTPLQNDLHELWSLLNLLLPEVFDNSKAFHDWFSKPFQKDNQTIEDDWLETEKKVIVIHRLHQILEPFMLRRRVEDVEGSLPPKISIVLKCKMSAHQAAIYDWVKATGTIRLDPAEEQLRVAGGSKRQVRAYAPLQNKCMELRKVCNHPYLNYPPLARAFNENVVRMCGKLWILDRILIKLQRAGHRVLLFSTMTKLLDILEDYLQWRGLIYRRIDGTTPLDSREAAIVDFNAPGTQCFIFLLSIRAAGRGLNLQTADTVVIYDPDPNPKNEEQAVARAHRIGQKSEVKVIYMEAVVDTIPSYQKEDEIRNGGSPDVDDEMLAGKDRYMGSVESLVRNNIQQHKIDMADEVINAGRFDQRTTHEERRMTLEALLHDEERYQDTVHDVPTLKEVNRMISRSSEEVELFDQMDEECEWPGDMVGYDEVPEWLHVGSDEVNGAIRATSKQSLSRGGSGGSGIIGTKAEEDKLLAKSSYNQKRLHRRAGNGTMSKAGKPAATLKRGGQPAYEQLAAAAEETEELEEVDADTSSQGEEDDDDGEVRPASEDEEEADVKSRKAEVQAQDDSDEEQEEEEEEEEEEEQEEEEEDNGSSEEVEDQSPGTQTEAEDLEEGEIVVSGESRPDSPPSGNWAANEQEEEQLTTTTGTTPRKKRKRSTRPRRSFMGNVPVQEAYPAGYMPSSWRGAGGGAAAEVWGVAGRGAAGSAAPRGLGWNSPAATPHGRQQSGRAPEAPTAEDSRNVRSGPRMQENVQKKCKQVLSKLQGAMNRDGRQVSALLMELPKQHELPDYYKLIDKPIDAKTIEEHLDRFDYATVLDFTGDVQLMLDNASRYNTSNAEVQADARRLHSLFFQRMGLMFPDVDFNSIKISIGMASRASGSRSSRKQRQVFSEVGRLVEEETKAASREQERKRTAGDKSSSRAGRSTSSRITGQDSGGFLHPADLVVYKGKRSSRRSKTRPKAAAAAAAAASKRKRTLDANTSSSLSGRRKESELKGLVDSGGPLSWARARAVAAALAAGGDTPRKKPRTDSARRRLGSSSAGRSS